MRCVNFSWCIPTGSGVLLEMLFETRRPQSLTQRSRRVLNILCVCFLSLLSFSAISAFQKKNFSGLPDYSTASVVLPRIVATPFELNVGRSRKGELTQKLEGLPHKGRSHHCCRFATWPNL